MIDVCGSVHKLCSFGCVIFNCLACGFSCQRIFRDVWVNLCWFGCICVLGCVFSLAFMDCYRCSCDVSWSLVYIFWLLLSEWLVWYLTYERVVGGMLRFVIVRGLGCPEILICVRFLYGTIFVNGACWLVEIWLVVWFWHSFGL